MISLELSIQTKRTYTHFIRIKLLYKYIKFYINVLFIDGLMVIKSYSKHVDNFFQHIKFFINS